MPGHLYRSVRVRREAVQVGGCVIIGEVRPDGLRAAIDYIEQVPALVLFVPPEESETEGRWR